MAKWVTSGCYAVVFGESVELHFGDKIVEHRKPHKDETELEVAISLIKHYRVNGGYTHWLKLNRIIENNNLPLKRYKTQVDYLNYLSSDYVKNLDELEKKVYDTSLNDIWGGINDGRQED